MSNKDHIFLNLVKFLMSWKNRPSDILTMTILPILDKDSRGLYSTDIFFKLKQRLNIDFRSEIYPVSPIGCRFMQNLVAILFKFEKTDSLHVFFFIFLQGSLYIPKTIPLDS